MVEEALSRDAVPYNGGSEDEGARLVYHSCHSNIKLMSLFRNCVKNFNSIKP